MFSMVDFLIIAGAIIVAGILWKTIKTVAKLLVIIAIAWVLLKFVGYAPSSTTEEVSFIEIPYSQNV